MDREKDFPDKVVETWKWPVQKADYHVPDRIDPAFFFCREHGREREELLPFRYEGQELYVCRSCGTVYEIIPESDRKLSDPLRIWPVLFRQPYDWHYIKNPALLKYHYVHECEGITTHPLLDAHCKGDRTESLELLARFFDARLYEAFHTGVCFFRANRNQIRVSRDDDALILSSGEVPGSFPADEFCVYREEPDSVSLEASHSWEENICGFTLDPNEEDYESYQGYRLIRLTYLGDDEGELFDRIRELDKHPLGQKPISASDGDRKITRQLVRDPFGLDGFFMYEDLTLTKRSEDSK